jgi:glycosyltransferase involved in cell wall biosynthesis
MKITIVLGAFFPLPPIMGGAVEKGWFALGQEFVRQGHEVVQISRRFPQFPDSEVISGVRHIRAPGFDTPRSLVWLKFLDLVYSQRLRKILPPADILVTNTFWLPVLVRNSEVGKIYVHVARFPKGQLRLYKHAARLQAPSSSIGDAIKDEVPGLEKKVVVIPYPRPETLAETPPPPLEERSRSILYVGRVHPEKGVHLLVEAFAESGLNAAGWKLVVIGSAESRHGGGGPAYADELRRTIQNRGAPVELRGPVYEPAALEKEFRSARLFVYPSLAERGETFGLAPLEAMTQGCPVLVSNLGCFHDFIRENESGFFFDHRAANPTEALGARLQALTRDEALLARVAEAGYRRSADFTLERVAARFLHDFEKLT